MARVHRAGCDVDVGQLDPFVAGQRPEAGAGMPRSMASGRDRHHAQPHTVSDLHPQRTAPGKGVQYLLGFEVLDPDTNFLDDRILCRSRHAENENRRAEKAEGEKNLD